MRTEPIEPQDVIKPEDNAETLSSRPNQTLISTQTITHEYLTLSGKVARETVKKNGSVTDVLDFVYDESGRPFALNYSTNGSSFTTYYYILNLQGDVVKLVTASGSAVATYEYDAWGNILSKSGTMADKNPLRYRGYYYDVETGFYYLQSRYYDPVNRRFINADTYASTGQGFIGTNMFAYCNNLPTAYSDHSGHAADARFNVSYMCDGMRGLTTEDLLLRRELISCNESAFLSAIDGAKYYHLKYNLLDVDASWIVSFCSGTNGFSGFDTASGIICALAGFAVTALTGNQDAADMAQKISGVVLGFVPGAVESIAYCGMPTLDNGKYDVYTIDAVTSIVYSTHGTPGYTEYHRVTKIYFPATYNWAIATEISCYTVDIGG